MTQPINLRRARKDRLRAAERARADADAARHGRTRAEREAEEAAEAKTRRHHEGHRLPGEGE